jgi:hypothetical protein
MQNNLQFDYFATTGRIGLSIVDAHDLGYLVGHREDSSLQLREGHTNIDVSCNFLDNYFEKPDLDRFLETFKRLEPSVAVIGDVYSRSQAERFEYAIDHLRDHGHTHNRFVVVPKSPEAAAALGDETSVGTQTGTVRQPVIRKTSTAVTRQFHECDG